jgi:hypothetical protein
MTTPGPPLAAHHRGHRAFARQVYVRSCSVCEPLCSSRPPRSLAKGSTMPPPPRASSSSVPPRASQAGSSKRGRGDEARETRQRAYPAPLSSHALTYLQLCRRLPHQRPRVRACALRRLVYDADDDTALKKTRTSAQGRTDRPPPRTSRPRVRACALRRLVYDADDDTALKKNRTSARGRTDRPPRTQSLTPARR